MNKDINSINKPIIALLHLDAFPGDPYYKSGITMKQIVAQAGKDLEALQKGGVDAILFSNEFGIPYRNVADHLTTAAMGRIIGELLNDISVPYGVDLLQDPINIIDLAVAVDASFVREQFTGAVVGEGGIFRTDIAETLRRKRQLGADELKMFYFLNNESDTYLNDRDYATIVKSMVFKCHPDGICVAGIHAGNDPRTDWISEVKQAAGSTKVFCNTGCRKENICEKLTVADGAFVGTTFKVEGKFENFIDYYRVKDFMDIVKEFRGE